MKDLYSNLKSTLGLKPQVATATKNGASVNMADFGSALFLALIGLSADTLSGSVKIEVAIEESDDDSTFTAAADEDVLGAITGGATTGTLAVIDDAAEDEVQVKGGYIGYKQYARMVVKFVGTHTNGTPVAIANLRGHAEHKPV